jgi:hypothetical protein
MASCWLDKGNGFSLDGNEQINDFDCLDLFGLLIISIDESKYSQERFRICYSESPYIQLKNE